MHSPYAMTSSQICSYSVCKCIAICMLPSTIYLLEILILLVHVYINKLEKPFHIIRGCESKAAMSKMYYVIKEKNMYTTTTYTCTQPIRAQGFRGVCERRDMPFQLDITPAPAMQANLYTGNLNGNFLLQKSKNNLYLVLSPFPCFHLLFIHFPDHLRCKSLYIQQIMFQVQGRIKHWLYTKIFSGAHLKVSKSSNRSLSALLKCAIQLKCGLHLIF